MNKDIESIVKQFPLLKLQLNKGERYRIMRQSIKRGSLWILPRVDGYVVLVTGAADSHLYNFLCSHFGTEAGETQGRKFWKIQDLGDISRIIRRFSEG